MPDRIIHQEARLFADLPTTQDVFVIVTNPLNQVTVDGESATQWDEGRYSYTIPQVDMSGTWEVTWYDESEQTLKSQPFTVGPLPPAPMSKWEVKVQSAIRADEFHMGWVEEAFGDTFTDPTVLGRQGNYVGWWLAVQEGGYTTPRRVKSFTGSGFTVAPEFTREIPRGSSYILTPISFDEMEVQIRTTIAELSEIARIEVHVPNIPVENNSLYVPRGMTHVHSLTVGGEDIGSRHWTMKPGRRLDFESDTGSGFASLIGIRSAAHPQWEDSIVDYDPGTLQVRVASLVHAGRARGQATDMDEHLRRQLTAMDEYAMLRRWAAGRPYPGAKAVID